MLRLPRFNYVAPESVEEACSFLKSYEGKIKFLAGGTDLVPSMKDRLFTPDYVLDLKRVSGLNEIKGLSCFNPKGAFYAFFHYDFDMTSGEFSNYLLEKGRIVVTPGSAFGKSGEGFIRFSYAASAEKIQKCLAILADVVKPLQK